MAQNTHASRITCSGCDNTWTGTARCHCSGCHRLFGGLTLFDRHRLHGKCLDPATMTIERGSRKGEPVMRLSGGVWVDARDWDAAETFAESA